MTEQLNKLTCVPCRGGEPTVTSEERQKYIEEIPDWEIIQVDGIDRLQRKFKFKDFNAALEFTNKIGKIAEEEGHHPQIVTEWGKVTVGWWTHAIKGLHKNDFIMSAKTDQLMN